MVVGSSLVVELAENAGLVGLLAYSHASIRQGFEDALELARVAQLEAGRYEQLNTVLHTLQEAVLAVNQSEQIIAINPAMQRILGLVRAPRLSEPLASVTTDLSLRETLEGGQPEHGAVLFSDYGKGGLAHIARMIALARGLRTERSGRSKPPRKAKRCRSSRQSP